jgi:2-polyprenyl-3-methyl-5-hydroxy-6-metoxy-1,4-benzoquinol methylase
LTARPLETLDRRDAEPALVRRTLTDISVSNALFGGRQAVRWGLRRVLADTHTARPLTVLDVGAGRGDILLHVRRALAPRWRLAPLALDHLRPAARLCGEAGLPALVADLSRLPVGRHAVDLVVVSQVLHHLDAPAAVTLLRDLAAVAGVGVVVADLRRSPLAQAGIWTASHLLGFHAVTRRDGVASVGSGFTPAELAARCREAGVHAHVSRRPGWRLVAWWRT